MYKKLLSPYGPTSFISSTEFTVIPQLLTVNVQRMFSNEETPSRGRLPMTAFNERTIFF